MGMLIRMFALILLFAYSIQKALEGFGINISYFNSMQIVFAISFLLILIREIILE